MPAVRRARSTTEGLLAAKAGQAVVQAAANPLGATIRAIRAIRCHPALHTGYICHIPTGERGSRSALVFFFRSTSLPCCAAIFKINLATAATAVVVVAVVVVAAVAVMAASAAVYIYVYIYMCEYICGYIHIYMCI